MNYPPPRTWHKLEPAVEQGTEIEPELIIVAPDLRLPADWSAERRQEFLERWQRTGK